MDEIYFLIFKHMARIEDFRERVQGPFSKKARETAPPPPASFEVRGDSGGQVPAAAPDPDLENIVGGVSAATVFASETPNPQDGRVELPHAEPEGGRKQPKSDTQRWGTPDDVWTGEHFRI